MIPHAHTVRYPAAFSRDRTSHAEVDRGGEFAPETLGPFISHRQEEGMNDTVRRSPWPSIVLALALGGGGIAIGYQLAGGGKPSAPAGDTDEHGHAHGEEDHHDHGHEADTNQLPLSDQARRNLGLKTAEVELTDYWHTIEIPGTVAELPGHSERRVTTTVGGIVQKVNAFPGQSVKPGQLLFELEPTGDALATAQASLLKTLQEIDLVNAELERISPLVASGAMPEKNKLEREYELKRLESTREVQMQELHVRGLSKDQIDAMVKSRQLIRKFEVRVPPFPASEAKELSQGEEPLFSIERIDVFPGKLVQAGEELCDLAVHTMLSVEGQAFEREVGLLTNAVREQWPVTAIFETGDSKPLIREGLHIRYIENVVDPTNRTIRFFIPLKNDVVRDITGPDKILYRSWLFKPGQKVRLLVPVEKWTEQILVPPEGVVRDGPESFVFRVNGKLMERVPVQVVFQDPTAVVIANDGSLFPGDEIAANSAYQLDLALKKASGSGVDMHAGHNH